MTTAVHILTTEGPVRIQRIAEEDPTLHSVICLDGRAQVLPVSPDYEAFVRRPVGVIERLTGHGAYRMDVAQPLDAGRSWQLPALIAHLFHVGGGPVAVGDVYATGEVDSDLAVRPVDHVQRKLTMLAEALARAPAGERAVILVPEGTPDLPDEIAGVPVVAVATVEEAVRRVGLEIPGSGPPTPGGTGDPVAATSPIGRRVAWLSGTAAVAGLVFWLALAPARWAALADEGQLLRLEEQLEAARESTLGALRRAVFGRWLAVGRPPANAVGLESRITVAADPAACEHDAGETARMPAGGVPAPGVVCTLEIRGIVARDRVLTGRMAYWPRGIGTGEHPARVMRGHAGDTGRTWILSFRDPPGPEAAVRLIAIVGHADVNGPQPWYRVLLSAPRDGPVFAAARDRVERLGYRVVVHEWQAPDRPH